MMNGALHGLRVLDCTHVIAGAYCSLLLADLGADVVKIEPLRGEVTRGRAEIPFKPYDFVNRNKRAIAVDTQSADGAAVILRLAKDADIFVENYRPGALEKMGLGYEALSKANERLVYASISGFGQTGPYRDRGGLDLVAQAMSGIMSFTGEIGSERPMSSGVPLSDLNAGTFAALGILAAIHHRSITGRGQYVETSLLESAMAYTMWETGMALTMGVVAERVGTRHRLAAPYEALRTRDGWLVVGVNTEKLWKRLCEAIGAPELCDDPLFAVGFSRLANRDELAERLEAILAAEDTETWVARINEAGVPCGPINTITDALDDPHVAARGFLQDVDGRRFPRTPLTLSETPVEIARGPARIGEHTIEMLREAGYDEASIADLAARKVIAS
jgi:crotonobetainyl-CoA:carnitine CoA-transferase CaiB-like acyl-CoA transferase